MLYIKCKDKDCKNCKLFATTSPERDILVGCVYDRKIPITDIKRFVCRKKTKKIDAAQM